MDCIVQLVENERHAARRLLGGRMAMLVWSRWLLVLLRVEMRLVGLRHILLARALAGLPEAMPSLEKELEKHRPKWNCRSGLDRLEFVEKRRRQSLSRLRLLLRLGRDILRTRGRLDNST